MHNESQRSLAIFLFTSDLSAIRPRFKIQFILHIFSTKNINIVESYNNTYYVVHVSIITKSKYNRNMVRSDQRSKAFELITAYRIYY
jgi:hypothetical protein